VDAVFHGASLDRTGISPGTTHDPVQQPQQQNGGPLEMDRPCAERSVLTARAATPYTMAALTRLPPAVAGQHHHGSEGRRGDDPGQRQREGSRLRGPHLLGETAGTRSW